jgi:hypothetical protein
MQRSEVLAAVKFGYMDMIAAAERGDALSALWFYWWCLHVTECAQEYDTSMRRLSRFYFVRPDLLFPSDAPAAVVLRNRSEKGFLQFMHMTPAVFDVVLANVDADWTRSRLPAGLNGRPGRPNMLTAEMCVALAITYMATSVNESQLESLYGVGHSVENRDVHDGLVHLEAALVRLGCTPTWPSIRMQQEFAQVMDEYWGRDVYDTKIMGIVDGLRLDVREPGDAVAQNALYSGFTKTINCVNQIVVTINGKIVSAEIGYAGRISDSTLQRILSARLRLPGVLAPGHGICADDIYRNVLTDDIYITQYHDPGIADVNYVMANRARFARQQKAKRQGVEWTMRTLQNMWARLKKPLPWAPALRCRLIRIAIMLHNLVAEHVANHNELKTVYMETFLRHGGQ